MKQLETAREQLIGRIMRLLVWAGLVAYVPSVLAAFAEHLYPIVLVDSLVYLFVIWSAYSPRSSVNIKILALVYSSFLVGCFVLFLTGPQGAGYIWFISGIVLSALLGKPRLMLVQVALVVLVFVAYSISLHLGWIAHDQPVLSVVIIGSNLLLVSGLLAFLIQQMLQVMNNAYMGQNRLALSLEERLTESEQYRLELGRSLQHKDELLRELHHRVKNNLQVLDSLLQLHASLRPQSAESGDRGTSADLSGLLPALRRHVAMVAAVNDLFLQRQANSAIPLTELLDAVLAFGQQPDTPRSYACQVSGAPADLACLPQDAVLLALVCAELIAVFHSVSNGCELRPVDTAAGTALEFELRLILTDTGAEESCRGQLLANRLLEKLLPEPLDFVPAAHGRFVVRLALAPFLIPAGGTAD